MGALWKIRGKGGLAAKARHYREREQLLKLEKYPDWNTFADRPGGRWREGGTAHATGGLAPPLWA